MFSIREFFLVALALSAFVTTSPTPVAQHDDHAHQAQERSPSPGTRPAAPYLLDTDPVTGEALGAAETQVVLEHGGRQLRFASERSAQAFRESPDRYLASVDKEIVRRQLPRYPLETCVVSNESLEESGDEVIDYVFGNRLVRFCCKPCRPKFLEDPDTYLARMDAALIAQQLPSYPLKTCVVSGEPLGGSMGDPIDHVVGDRLVRLCCKGCKRKLEADPVKYLRMLDEAAGRSTERAPKQRGDERHDRDGSHGGRDHGDHGDHDRGGR